MSSRSYQEFIESKEILHRGNGITIPETALHPDLKDFQRAVVARALRQQRFLMGEGMGLGKTFQILEWASVVNKAINEPVLIVGPLGAAHQTATIEAPKFGYDVKFIENDSDIQPGLNITNYEKLHKITTTKFGACAVDESSKLKAATGKISNMIIDSFKHCDFKLAASATFAPNSLDETGMQAEFLGIMSLEEMRSMFFTHDGKNTSQWDLSYHGQDKFWKWMCSWAVMMRKPSDIGFDDTGYELPGLNMHWHTTDVYVPPTEGSLFYIKEEGLNDDRFIRRISLEDRCKMAADIINASDDQWLIWCDLNDESKMLTDLIDGAWEITGSDKDDYKNQVTDNFINGSVQRIVTKPKMYGFGMNFQHSHKMMFVGLNHSWEQMFQAIGRQHRYGQQHPVDCHVVYDTKEGNVKDNLMRKAKRDQETLDQMVAYMKRYSLDYFGKTQSYLVDYEVSKKPMILQDWLVNNVAK